MRMNTYSKTWTTTPKPGQLLDLMKNERLLRLISYGKSSAYANDGGKHTLWMCDQSDHAVFVRSDLTAEHVLKAAVTI
jgi:hypothetical protein